jgi:hypothetical protein
MKNRSFLLELKNEKMYKVEPKTHVRAVFIHMIT